MDLGKGSGSDPPSSNFLFLFLVIIYFIFVVGPPSKALDLHFFNKANQPHPNSNYLTQKLNKNNKNIHNSDCILATTKKKKKKLFYYQRTKNHVLLEKLKLNFL